MKALKTLQDAMVFFSDATRCREYLVAQRWPDGVICPRCGSNDVLFLEKYNRWHCRAKHDAPQFTLKTGTVMEDSAIGLEKWLPAFWLLANCKNGISSYELHRALGVTQKSAWFMLHRIRLAMGADNDVKMGGPEGGPVEVDEAYIGGNPKNKHRSKRPKAMLADVPRLIQDDNGETIINPASKWPVGRVSDKVPVMGMLDREARKVRAKVIPHVDRKILQEAILENVSSGSTVYTDKLGAYANLNTLEFVHEAVNHVDEYVRGNVHTNGIENFWSLLKRGLKGTYVAVEPFHLDRYVTEQVFRYNNRTTKDNPLDDADRFTLAVSQISGKRLTYAELTGKVAETTEPFQVARLGEETETREAERFVDVRLPAFSASSFALIALCGTANMRRVNRSRAAVVPTTSLAGVVGPFASGVPSRKRGYATAVPKSIFGAASPCVFDSFLLERWQETHVRLHRIFR